MRTRAGLDILSAGRPFALRAPDGRIGVHNGKYGQVHCGELPPDAEVLARERGMAVLADAGGVTAVTLSGNALFRAPEPSAANVVGDTVVLGDRASIELRDLRGVEVLDRPAEPSQCQRHGSPLRAIVNSCGPRAVCDR